MSYNNSTPILTIDSKERIIEENSKEVSNEKTYHFSINGAEYGTISIDAKTRNALLKHVYDIADDLVNESIIKSAVEKKIRLLGQRIHQFLIPAKLAEYFYDKSHGSILIRTSEQDIPWEIIYDKIGFLCHRIAFGRETSRKKLDNINIRPTINICLIGNPNSNLSAAGDEVKQLSVLFSNTLNRLQENYTIKTELKVLENENANINNVLFETIASSDVHWDIIHYAGHADFNQLRPDSSSLILSDGKLRAYEIEQGLRSQSMVFVNACYSGMIAQQDSLTGYGLLKGIASSFVKAGALGYIGSIWPITDFTAKKISEYFYISILEGVDIGESLMIAKATAIKENLDLASIGYILYGDPLSKLPLFEPPQTWGPFVNEQGLDHIVQLEAEYSALEILLANDLPWILWRHVDFSNWIKRTPGSKKTHDRMLSKLIEYRQHFRNLVLNGKKKFIGLTNLKTLRKYLLIATPEEKLDLLDDMKNFSCCSNFTLMFYEGDEEEIEEIEVVSKNDDVFFNLTESVYVFNKQVRFEQRPITYSVSVNFNPDLVKQYANRFYKYYENNVLQYATRKEENWSADPQKIDNKTLNAISISILEEAMTPLS